MRLFIRDGQRMILTDAGQVLVLQVREGLNTLSQAFDEVRARPRRTGASSTLTVSVLPSFTIRWLVRVGQLAIEDASSWFLAWREPLRCNRPDFEAFVRWLQQEADSA